MNNNTPVPCATDSAGNSRPVVHRTRNQHFPKTARIHSPREFDALFQNGRVLADSTLVIHASPAAALAGQSSLKSSKSPKAVAPTAMSTGRMGISISKRVGCAPLRNRWKRLIREAYRRHLRSSPALGRLDIVVRPRRGATADYWAIERSLLSLTVRLDKQLFKGPNRSS